MGPLGLHLWQETGWGVCHTGWECVIPGEGCVILGGGVSYQVGGVSYRVGEGVSYQVGSVSYRVGGAAVGEGRVGPEPTQSIVGFIELQGRGDCSHLSNQWQTIYKIYNY